MLIRVIRIISIPLITGLIISFYPVRDFISNGIGQITQGINSHSLRTVRGTTSGSFQKLAKYIGERNSQEVIEGLARLGFKEDEIDKAVKEVVEFIEMESVSWGWWSKLVKESKAALLAFPRIIALDSGKKPYLLIRPDFREKRKIFNNKSLSGLVGFFERSSPQVLIDLFSELTLAHFNVDRIYVMRKVSKTLPQLPEEWRERQEKLGSNFDWKELLLEPPEIEIKLIEIIAGEEIFPQLMEQNPVYEYYNLNQLVPLYLLKRSWINRFLITSYENHATNIVEYKKFIQAYPSKDNIHYDGKYYYYLWIDYVRNYMVKWSQHEVPESIIEHLILRTAQEKGKEISELEQEDFEKLDFLRHMTYKEEISFDRKGLKKMIYSNPYSGMEGFRKKVITPFKEKMESEIEDIKREVIEKGKVEDWNKYSLWARKTYIEEEVLNPKDKTWEKLTESDLPEGFLNTVSFQKDLNIAKAILWVDLDLFERTEIHPITTEDYVIRLLLFDVPIVWEETSKGMRKDWVKMLARQEGVTIEEILSQPASSDIWDKKIDFISDPLNIFSKTFHTKLVPLSPFRKGTDDWSLRAMLDEVYNGDPDELRKDLFKED